MALRRLKSFEIDDDLRHAENGAIEVTVTFADGRRRWCSFMTPTGLSNAGDWISATRIRIHCGSPQMIVVSELDASIIQKALHHIQSEGELEACTRPVD